MSTVATHVVTAEELWQMPDNGKQRVLIEGEVIETMPPGGRHGVIASEVTSCLRNWAKSGPGGRAGVESGFILRRNPDTVRSPDVFYVRPERIPASGIPEAFWELAPDVAIEVVSPHDSADEVRAKVHDYLAAGTALVWVIYPRTQEVLVHTPDGRAQTYTRADVLEAFAVLPGFRCPVADLFA